LKKGLSEGVLQKQHLFQFPVPVYTKIWTGGHATVRGERYKTGRAKEFVFEWWEESSREETPELSTGKAKKIFLRRRAHHTRLSAVHTLLAHPQRSQCHIGWPASV
jgi:hypothetical protein